MVIIVFNGFFCYVIFMINIVIIYVLRKVFFLEKFLKVLFLSFIIFDFGVGLLG